MEKKRSRVSVPRDWRDLPPDILGSIAAKLVSFFDIVSFRGVCSSWRIAASHRRNKKLFSIILYFAQKDLQKGYYVNPYDDVLFFDINQKKPCQVTRSACSSHRDIRNHKLVGSHPQGWLIMSNQIRHCYLIRLFSMIRIELPDMISCSGELRYSLDQFQVAKAILSVINSTNHAVMIKMFDAVFNEKIAIWRSGDKQWTCIPGVNYIDIAFCDNEPYALRVDSNNNQHLYVESFDFGISFCLPVKKLSIRVPIINNAFLENYKLVSSSASEILVVTCLSGKCLVWKVDLSEKRCISMKSLNGNSLIFGNVTCAFVSADDVEDHGYQRNAVYLAKNDDYKRLSIYNLEDGDGVEHPWETETDKQLYCFGFIHLFC